MGEIKKLGLVREVLDEGPKMPELVRMLNKKEFREIIKENGFLFVRPYTRWWRDYLPDTAVQIDDNVIAIVNGPAKIGFHAVGSNAVYERDVRVIYLEKDKDGKVWVKIYLR